MTIRSRLIAVLFLALFLLPSTLQAQDVFEVTGQYVGSEYGDYTYAIMRINGEDNSFFCAWPFLEVLDALRPAREITFVVSGRNEFIPEAGAEMWIEEVTAIFIPDEYSPEYGLWLTNGQAGQRP